jgi:RNA polymerase sigma factor (sigma-70 family)
MSDNLIIEEVLAGNKSKYEHLMRKYNQQLYRVAKGYIKDDDEIEDLMQETYIKAYSQLSKFEHKSKFATWLIRILINECLMALRKKSRVITMHDEVPFDSLIEINNPENTAMNSELKDILENAIENLPPKYRAVFIMREVEAISVNETGQLLNISESNVKVRLNRAKEMLKDSIMNNYPVSELFNFNLVRCDRIVNNVLSKI